MGYNTKFKGVLKFGKEPSIAQLQKLNLLLGGSVSEGSYCQFQLLPDYSGLEWDNGEKFYDAEIAAQWVIDEMRKEFPGFELIGTLRAQGEDIEDTWLLKCSGNKAEKIELKPEGIKIKCPDCKHEFYWEMK